ncbi:MAG: FAD-dependent oxidoreductase, partial [Methyloligellaceae bacterium]
MSRRRGASAWWTASSSGTEPNPTRRRVIAGTPAKILVVGAGPVGLTAAVELTRRGHGVRIIDKGGGPVPESRALAVNARTLEILEPCGATEIMLARGTKIERFNIWDPPKLRITVAFKELDHRFNFMLALAQNETEHILQDRLNALGPKVEWTTGLTGLSQEDGVCHCEISSDAGSETARFETVIGADGARSTVREAVGIGFHGKPYPDQFGLADVTLSRGPVGPNEANVFRLDDRIFGAIPMGGDRYRLIANQPDVF